MINQTIASEDMEHNFAGMIMCTHVGLKKQGWILDSGAKDHMTYIANGLLDKRLLHHRPKITLPNGELSEITHTGRVILDSRLELQDVLLVPSFKCNLLSVPKLAKDNKCIVIFYPIICIIQDLVTKKILGIGREHKGLYFLMHKSVEDMDINLQEIIKEITRAEHFGLVVTGNGVQCSGSYGMWQKRLDHAPSSKLEHLSDVQV